MDLCWSRVTTAGMMSVGDHLLFNSRETMTKEAGRVAAYLSSLGSDRVALNGLRLRNSSPGEIHSHFQDHVKTKDSDVGGGDTKNKEDPSPITLESQRGSKDNRIKRTQKHVQ